MLFKQGFLLCQLVNAIQENEILFLALLTKSNTKFDKNAVLFYLSLPHLPSDHY